MGRNIVVEETYILSIISISKSISNSRSKLAPRRKLGRFSARATRRVARAITGWARGRMHYHAVCIWGACFRARHTRALALPLPPPPGRAAAAARAPGDRSGASPAYPRAAALPSSEEQRPSARCRIAPVRCLTKRLQGVYCSNFMNLVHVLNCSFYSIVLNIVDEFVV